MIKAQVGKRRRTVYISSETEDSGTDSEVEGSRISEKSVVTSISTFEHLPSSNEKCEIMDVTKTRLCENLLKKLMSHKDGWVFNTPVDPVLLQIPDYFKIIHNPMDLGTVKKKLASKQYMSTHDFVADVELTFSNAMKYNPPGNDVHIMAKRLNNIFNSEWKLLERKWRKGNLVSEQQPAKIMKVQAAFTSKTIVHKKLTVCSDSLVRKSLTNAKSSKSAQVIRNCAAQGSGRASSKDVPSQTLAGREGCLRRSISCIQERFKISRMQVDEHNHELNGNELRSYSDHSSSPIASSGQAPGEENHLYEEPLSPSKALRAAMLKTRFAGTIVKAQQKALLDHGKKIDPAKLRLEKEKLEKRQQEEKARIEAQVKAAEAAAQMKVEAEMRMKREKEREAARLALQMMKKTVDIDNSDLLKDLEKLSKKWHLNTPGKLIVDFVDGIELPPGLGSPLERLGLFIKNDLEEEIEDKMEDCISPTDNADVEEGEIG